MRKDCDRLFSSQNHCFFVRKIIMESRRARDPRLSRVDPRRQHQRSPSNSNAPVNTSPQPQTHYQGIPAAPVEGQASTSANTIPPYPTASPYPDAVVSNGQLADEAQGAVELGDNLQSEAHTSYLSLSTYKPRPLFCVVCASNQVSPLLVLAKGIAA